MFPQRVFAATFLLSILVAWGSVIYVRATTNFELLYRHQFTDAPTYNSECSHSQRVL